MDLKYSCKQLARKFLQLNKIGADCPRPEMNTVSFRTSAFVNTPRYQYCAFYGEAGCVCIARRERDNESDWVVQKTDFVDTESGCTDTHNIISIGCDSSGVLHVVWGMHASPLNYAVSLNPIDENFPIRFLRIPSMTGCYEERMTYPEFHMNLAGELMFFYRSGVPGNGKNVLITYDAERGKWSQSPGVIFDGGLVNPAVSAYSTNLVFDDKGFIHAFFNGRYQKNSPMLEEGYQTNHDLYYAVSSDGGVSWSREVGRGSEANDGAATWSDIYEAPPSLAIAEGSSLMNQGTACLMQGNAVAATWWAPRAHRGDHTREYVVVIQQGGGWKPVVITERPKEAKKSEHFVRELARPLVLSDRSGRLLLITRSNDRGDVITVGFTKPLDFTEWFFFDLTDSPLPEWEPVCDRQMWEETGRLCLLFNEIDDAGFPSVILSLDWDAKEFFEAMQSSF